MLHVRIAVWEKSRLLDKNDTPITDMESEFVKTEISLSDTNRKLVKLIDGGELISKRKFIDRFGVTLYVDSLSTGCKSALVVANNPDKEYELDECGHNARDAIIELVREGNIILFNTGLEFPVDSTCDKDIDVQLNGFRFRSLNRLNYYIHHEYPYMPSKEFPGFQEVTGAKHYGHGCSLEEWCEYLNTLGGWL